MRIEVFIFNYGRYYDAKILYDSFSQLGYKTYLLNCESPTDPPFKATETIIKLPNIYYSGQWNEALKLAQGDVLFLINSDVKIPKPKLVMHRMKKFYNHYGHNAGIYAPDHYWTPWTYDPATLETVEFGLKKVPATDSTLWAVSKDIAQKVGHVDLKVNHLGWGIEIVSAYHCYKEGKLVVRDYSVHCNHPENTSYNRNSADNQWRSWVPSIGLGVDFWDYYNSRNRFGFGWHGHHHVPTNELKLL